VDHSLDQSARQKLPHEFEFCGAGLPVVRSDRPHGTAVQSQAKTAGKLIDMGHISLSIENSGQMDNSLI
jgi:hypothetical protein